MSRLPRTDRRAVVAGVLGHLVVVFAAASPLARAGSGLDSLGLVLLGAAAVGYGTGSLADSDADAAHTAFVAGVGGGMAFAAAFTALVLGDLSSGAYFDLHAALANVGIPSWLVARAGAWVVVAAGLVLGVTYALAALAGGGVAVGDVLQVERGR